MKVSLSTDAPTKIKADLLAIGVRAGQLGKDTVFKQLDKATDGALSAAAKREDFTGKNGESLRVTVSGLGAPVVLVLGLGDGERKERDVRSLAVKASQAASRYHHVALVMPDDVPDEDRAVRVATEGLITGSYKYTRYLTGDRLPKRRTETAKIVVAKSAASAKDALRRGTALGETINFVRDLVNAPPNDLTPTALAEAARTQSEAHGLSCKVWDKKGIEKLGMNLFLAVNRGSAEEPRLVHMAWKPAGAKKGAKKIVFVGKGLTFDSGGLCIKPPKSMVDMKCDMAGAAVTIGVLVACARLGLPVEVHGFIGATENMTGPAAYRPGDVFSSLDGKTVEIINTDAEGRLVLADVLTYAAREIEPDYLIDHATLTGACMVALGPWRAGLFANDDELANRYQKAADAEGETFWRMPLDEELRELLKSDIADMKHVGEQYGGSITAALFLREFIGQSKWMHLDIAGPAFLDRPHGAAPKGGTGFGVTTAVRFLEALGESA
ncbi:leucyl aminopeptidase [Sandaracinus amylolyticus]|uniref:leucyl aminopeptidase n=1 Tax=Sandaracinus amylolyticus TaxID=927083 RepID=UPI001EFFA322|nr:leucyl aminopeptidase [Sandaracinus amylolyticus]UJR81820.1 Cytosol aminopeptidase PepA [Sandaracinus amylolyticus]